MPRLTTVCLALLLLSAGPAAADTGHPHGQGPAFGSPAEAGAADRTVEVVMSDIGYDVDAISVGAGETVRFVVYNRGQLVHEFNIGTRGLHRAHREEMQAMMASGKMSPTGMAHGADAMGHDDPNSVLLEPGESAELVWRFDGPVEKLEFACNVPGHYQAGMVGPIRFHR